MIDVRSLRARSTLLVLFAWGCACGADHSFDPTFELVRSDASDVQLPDLNDDLQSRFDDGDALFEQPFREGDGLGPVYIRRACVSCHEGDAKGPGGVTKFAWVEPDGVTPIGPQLADYPFGNTERRHTTAGATIPILTPPGATTLRSKRIGPAVFARGYLEAISDDEILRVEAAQAQRTDGIAGIVNRVPFQSAVSPSSEFYEDLIGRRALIGRFGLKARIATLEEFVADALQGDMSITSPQRPLEPPNPERITDDLLPGQDLPSEDVYLLADYLRLLDMPAREPRDDRGAQLFDDVRCSVCHVPSLHTRPDYPIPQLADIDAFVYSDLLLHDMGADLADGVVEFDATSTQWRTTPLIGMRHLRSLLHDGRAKTVLEAVLAHDSDGSEAHDSILRFSDLSDDDQNALVTFVEQL